VGREQTESRRFIGFHFLKHQAFTIVLLLFFPQDIAFFQPSCNALVAIFRRTHHPTFAVGTMEQSLFHHFALPQRLPDSEDANLNDVEARLTDHLLGAVRLMRDSAARDDLRFDVSSIWERLRQCLVVSKIVTRDGRVDRTRLLSELRGITALGAILLDIRSQNAALLIHRLSE
jgi:hypothetical protein